MDFRPALRSAAHRLASSLYRFAETKGWPAGSYAIRMAVNIKWEQFLVEFYANAFDRIQSHDPELYDEILDFLEREHQDEPDLYAAVGLVIRPLEKFFNPIPRDFGEDTILLDEDDLHPSHHPRLDQVPHS